MGYERILKVLWYKFMYTSKRNMSKLKLKKGDCYKHLKKLPDHSVDLILTDPPYNLNPYSTGNLKCTWRKDF